MRELLVACEVGLSVVLLVGAVLLVRSLMQLQRVDPGFRPEHVVTFKVTLPQAAYPNDADQLRAFAEIERRLRSVPGVETAGATSTLALRGYTWTGDATIEGHGGDDYERELRHESVTPDYFRAIGVGLVAGRFLSDRDGKDSNVTLVNQALAQKYFPGANAVGKRIKFGRPPDEDAWMTIVGVVGNEKQDGMDQPAKPEAYVALPQNPQNPLTFVMRATTGVDATVAAARREVRAVNTDLALTDIAAMTDVIESSMGDASFRTALLAGFAGVALFLAALGVYGVLTYFVSQRSRELGIRLALGAKPQELFTMVVWQGMRPVAVGAAAGLAGAAALATVIESLLFGVRASDPATYAVVVCTLVAASLAACAIPARRATHVDPLIALRVE